MIEKCKIFIIKKFKYLQKIYKIFFVNTFFIIKTNMQETIPNLWKKNFKKNRKQDFMWDNIFWMQTKKDFIIKTYMLSQYIKDIPWKNIWIMIPSVGSASMIIMATYLAWKTPVMFNWTIPKDAFKHCLVFSWVMKILTSSNFYDRVKNDFLEEHKKNDKFVFLEDLLKDISLKKKIKVLFKSIFMPLWKYEIDKYDEEHNRKLENETAVILFTSWSESLPKAVALTHKNLIENIKWALSIFKLKEDDRLLWFLPPFHSFWFTINTIMPLISWMQVVYTPDPNDAKTILEIIKHTKVTSITSTPTFLKMILSLAQVWDLDSIRYVVVWAEKCPDEVFKKFSELCPNWKILEGYWITECSPVISINPLENPKPWTVWRILPNLSCKIFDLERKEELSKLDQWMIYIYWSSVFNWYLDDKLESPFEEINWNIYYKTWDLWFLDDDNYLTITGRLKRFIKIAWEMISLPFIESVLSEKYWSQNELKIAIEALENNWEAKIVLFSISHLEVEEVNDYLRKRGVSNLVKISEIIKIEEIPVLWTWKIDYKELKKKISF